MSADEMMGHLQRLIELGRSSRGRHIEALGGEWSLKTRTLLGVPTGKIEVTCRHHGTMAEFVAAARRAGYAVADTELPFVKLVTLRR